jgi:hypothetical protein
VWAAAFVAVLLLVPTDTRAGVYLFENESSKALAAIGGFTAAYTFERGAYMRRAWSLNAACYLVLLSRDLIRRVVGFEGSAFGISMHAISGGLVVVANASAVIGTFLLARAWTTAGLELPGSRATRYSVVAAAALLAVGICGSDLYVDGSAVLQGDMSSLHGVGSDIGDIISLCLIAPVLLTAIATRGGILKWTWGLLTASLIFWLLYDCASTIDHFVTGHDDTITLVRETFRALACVCEFSAGLAQRRAITEPLPDGVPA